LRSHRLFFLLAALWMLAMSWRLAPHFLDAIKVDGRLTTVQAFIEDACGERIGPAAAACLAETSREAQRRLRQEEAKSALLVLAPVLIYGAFFRPMQLLSARIRRRPRSAA